MDTNDAAVAEIIVRKGQHIPEQAQRIAALEFASGASMARNEEEQAECEKIAHSFKYEFVQSEGSVVFREKKENVSPYEEILEKGMNAPLSGGDNGMVTEPDGTRRPSLVPPQLWGQELHEYAKDPDPSFNNIQIKLQDLVPAWINDVVEDSKPEIADLLKPEIVKQLQSALGGGS